MILTIYIVIVALAVWIASRQLTKEGYLIADRNIPSWASALSLVVSKFGGGKILAGGSLIYLFGWSAMWFNIGFALGYMIFSSLALKLKTLGDTHKFYTLTDFYKQTTGQKSVLPIGILCIYTMLGFTCINIVGGAHILQKMTDIPYNTSILFVSGFIGTYLIIGGFKSVIITDIIQALIIISSLILFLVFVDLPPNISDGLSSFFSDITQTQIIYTFFMGFFFPFGMPEVWPRIYAVKHKNALKHVIPITIITYVGLGIGLAFLIISFRHVLPDMNPAQAILQGFQSLMPEYLSGIIAVFLFAAIMSSADTYLFQTNSSLEQDFKIWNRLGLKLDSVRLKMRLNIVFILAISTVVAFLLPDIVKVILLFAAGNFILGIFGLYSRFGTLKPSQIYYGVYSGTGAIVLWLIFSGIGFEIPLMAMLGTILGIVLSTIITKIKD